MAKADADGCADLISQLGRGTSDDRLGEHVGGDRGHGFEDFGTLVTLRDEVDSSAEPFTERNRVRYETAAPVIVPAAEATPLLPPGLRRRHRLVGVDSYLRLDIISTENPAKKAG